MAQATWLTRADRRVHAEGPRGQVLARYDVPSRWYVEDLSARTREPIRVRTAADMVREKEGWTAKPGISGGTLFDVWVKKGTP